ncbi:rhodanese-like domain-containing protein [Dyella sp.]|uniref:rhodanese-like domain-containing protein n=1 Tax=Dyella sp. TaxID=1869338 RepID=UPI002ED2E1AF
MSDFLQKLTPFIHNHIILVGLFVLVVLALIAMEIASLFRKYKEVSPAGLTLLINRESPLMIDLSAYADFEKAHVPGARHVAMSQFDPESKDLAAAKDLPVVVMDKDGRGEAQRAAQRLVKAGFAKVFFLGGGVAAWQQAQLPTAKGRK